MKFKHILFTVLLSIAVMGCTETFKVEPDAYEAPLFFKSSDSKVVFDTDGGKAVITIATNAGSWEIASDASDWLGVEIVEDKTLVISAPQNISNDVRAHKVVLQATKGEENARLEVAVSQRAEMAEDLSSAGLANCYIAKTNGSYMFRADVKGNGSSLDGKSTYVQSVGTDIEGVARAVLLWESRQDGDRSMTYEIIDGSPVYKDKYVKFNTGRSEGNAVIAVLDIEGYVIWSWHIWVTDTPVTSHDHKDDKGNVVAQIMDRNLGALNNIPMDVRNRGMFYQMGRKDPFVPCRSPYKDIDSGNVPEYNQPNYEVGDGIGRWELTDEFTSKPIQSAPGNIPFAVENPMRFLYSFYSNSYTWFVYGDDAEALTLQSGLWGEEKKTIFDPCPAGYRVPGDGIWGTLSIDGFLKTGGTDEECDEAGTNPTYGWNKEDGCGRVWRTTGDFYPMVGNIYQTSLSTTPYNYCSGQTFYLTSHESPLKANYFFVAAFNGNWARYDTRAQVFSGQVRCIKE